MEVTLRSEWLKFLENINADMFGVVKDFAS